MMRFVQLVWLAQLCILCLAKRSQGILSSSKDFMYLDRFCFQSHTGTLEYSFKYPAYYPAQMLLLYFDTDDQWPRAYKQLETCRERVELLSNHSENNQIIRLSPYFVDRTGQGRCKIIEDQLQQAWVHCLGTRVFWAARSRWWFLAIANCDPEGDQMMAVAGNETSNETVGVYTEFHLMMTNGLPQDVLHYQFSDDEWLILPTDTIFLMLHTVLMIVTYIVGVNLSSRRLYHNTFRMCSQSIILDVCGLGMLVINYSIYSIDGAGLPVIKGVGQFIRGMAQMLFVYMCMVLARGLNVTKMRLNMFDKIFLTVMLFVFVVSYFAMLIWEIKYFDPATVIYQSESVPGYLLAVWKLVAWLFFCTGALLTREASPAKKHFFTSFTIFMTPWFWASPVVLMIANFALNNWVRAEVVNIVENCVVFYGYIVFLWLARPTNGNTNFPFHIRTTQIDIGFDPSTAYGNVNEGARTGSIDATPGGKSPSPEDDVLPHAQFE